MFNVGGGELLVIMLVALIVLGPQRLPEAARTVGKVVGEIRRLSSGFQREIRDAFDDSDVTRKPAEPAPLAAAVADVDKDDPADADDPDPLADLPTDEPPAQAGRTEPSPAAEAANGSGPQGSSANGGPARQGSEPGDLAPEVGDALDQVVAATPPAAPRRSEGPDDGADPTDERPPAEVRDDGPGDARAAS